MNAARDDKVRERAYAIWEREGQPEGGAERHWAQAEEELRAEEQGTTDPSAAPATPESASGPERGVGPDTRTTGPDGGALDGRPPRGRRDRHGRHP
jgi:Protein of unknown function (DUF2934)